MSRYEQTSFVIARWVVHHLVFPLFMGLHVTGRETVPKDRPYIVAANHLSNLDVPILMAEMPSRPSIMAKDTLYNIPWLRWFWRWGDAVPVRRGGMDRAALRAAEAKLAQGIPFGIFPEGTRSRTGVLGTGKPGAGMIALRSRVPVVPVAFTGTPDVFRGRRPHLRPRVTMTIGLAIPPEEIAAAGGSEAATELMMSRIAALLPPTMRGAYDKQEHDGAALAREARGQ
ncbi:MAG: 1-acyl-sn-glycerol-3-phosphate acyltransferase [Chloroflexota bacterium]|nr:1-acyl-sn-glycerol-3-phosphate acyltransferase [Chloroflexota bacterium]